MTTRRKVLVGVGVVLLGAAVVAANLYYKKADGKIVAVESIKKRDLEAIVSASGKIQPKTHVNISADTMGRVTELAVDEGDRVKRGPVPAADRSAQPAERRPARRSRRWPPPKPR